MLDGDISINTITVILNQLLGASNCAENYTIIIDSIGNVEERMQRITSIYESFDPVWPSHSQWTNGLMQRIALTLLPEIKTDPLLKQFIKSLVSQSHNSVPSRIV